MHQEFPTPQAGTTFIRAPHWMATQPGEMSHNDLHWFSDAIPLFPQVAFRPAGPLIGPTHAAQPHETHGAE